MRFTPIPLVLEGSGDAAVDPRCASLKKNFPSNFPRLYATPSHRLFFFDQAPFFHQVEPYCGLFPRPSNERYGEIRI